MTDVAIAETQTKRFGLLIDQLGFAYSGGAPLFSHFSLNLDTGTTALLGRSGAGKTTLLRLIAGRLTPSHGTVHGLDGRRVAWVGQSGGLMPWASLEENVILGARLRGETPDLARAHDLLFRLGLRGHEAKRPAELSGGMRQRAAVARAILEDAQIVLMDEPFVHLDAIAKARLYEIVARELSGRTTLLVTHDPLEALTIANRAVVLSGRRPSVLADVSIDGPTPRNPRDAGLTGAYERILSALERA